MSAPTGTNDQLLTVAEACRRLRISRWMLYRLIQSNQLRTVSIGKRRLIAPQAIGDFIAARDRPGAQP